MSKNPPVTVPQSEQQISKMFDRIAGRYDLLNALLSARQDRRWRHKMIEMVPYRPDGTFVDVATGTGDVILAAHRKHPEYRHFTGIDISPEMLKFARIKANQCDAGKQLQFETGSAERLPLADGSVDCLTIAFGLRNVVQRDKAISEFHRVLKPNGTLLILEFFNPDANWFSRLFQFYFNKVLPIIGGLISDREAYRYLPKSVPGFYTMAQLREVIYASGMVVDSETKFLFGGCRLIKAQKL